MAFRKIDINAPLWANVEDVSRTQQGAEKHNVLRDLSGSTIRRPGLIELADLGTSSGIDGLYFWEYTGLVYAVSNTNIYSIGQNGTITLVGSALFVKGTPVSFAETEVPTNKLFAANGGAIIEYNGTTAQALTDGDAPTDVTHVAILHTYLIAKHGAASRFSWSEVGNPVSWVGEYATAEGKPDKLSALHVAWEEIALFGTGSIETWYDDGTTPFTSLAGAAIESGTIAPYSIALTDNSYFMLDAERRVVRIAGRQVKVLSQAIDNILSDLSSVTNAKGDKFTFGGLNLFILSVGNKTIVFDYLREEWMGEWNYFDTTNSIFTRFRGQNFIYVPVWNMSLCGDYENGKIYQISKSTYTDDGATLRSVWITGNEDHGTSRRKRSRELKIRTRRGEGQTDQEPVLMVRWRDDGSKIWSNYVTVSLGKLGNYDSYRSLYALGSYISRQYEFSITDNIPLAMVEIFEDVELQR